ncbi:hypothetical protein FJW04_18275 [Mesorhizobium sp. B2-7-3]|nr:hypothetical protein FJW04_18275 [Mesorhizobium sp. B2-7-3]
MRSRPDEAIGHRVDAEKQRQLGYRVVEVANRAVDEIAELRREIGDLAKESGAGEVTRRPCSGGAQPD